MDNNNVSVPQESTVVQPWAEELTAPPATQKKRINRAKLQENIWGWIFVSALFIGTTVFVYIALVLSVWISFTNYDAFIMTTFWEGLKSIHPEGAFYWYKFMFSPEGVFGVAGESADFWGTLGTTCFYLIGIPIGMVLSLGVAVLMTRDIKGSGAFRVIYYIPTVASTVSIAIMWTNLFGSNGFITQLLGVNFITGEGATYWTQRWCIIILTVWKGLGGTVVLFVAGLNGVNASYHEAAEIDGANAWQIFWRITMPQLYPTIFYVLVTSVIGGMQIFAEPDLVFNGYPVAGNQATNGTRYNTPFVGYIYGNFEQGEWAHASALGIVLALIIFVLTLIQFGLDSRRDKI